MKCPHCLESFFESVEETKIGTDSEGFWSIKRITCPNCKKFTILLIPHVLDSRGYQAPQIPIMIRPKNVSRIPLDPSIPENFTKDYKKSTLVLSDSPEASAALSRRCLQTLLRDKVGVKKGDLNDEIQQVLDSKQLPLYLAKDLDAVRNIGNFATHPNKSKITGEIVDVESNEAEWTLSVLEGLFDFYFVQEQKAKHRRDELNKKLQEAGKPPMK